MTDFPELRVLQRQYFQLVEPRKLKWPNNEALKMLDVQSWLYTHMFDSNNIRYPPPDRYQLRVLKLLLSKLEKSIVDPEQDEISDDLMSAMSILLTSNIPSEAESAQQKAYVTYSYSQPSTADNEPADWAVTLLESRSVISSSGTTGLRTWEAALLLGSYLLSEQGRRTVRQKRVLELGAGTGMLSILCAKHLDIAGIVATDGDEAVVDAIKTNMFLNELDTSKTSACQVRTAALKWGWPIDATTFAEDYGMDVPDILLAADVTYERSAIPRLVSSLGEMFEVNIALEVVLSATIRNEQTFKAFLKACKGHGFSLEQIEFLAVPEHVQEGPFYPTSTPIQIWRITTSQPRVDPFAV